MLMEASRGECWTRGGLNHVGPYRVVYDFPTIWQSRQSRDLDLTARECSRQEDCVGSSKYAATSLIREILALMPASNKSSLLAKLVQRSRMFCNGKAHNRDVYMSVCSLEVRSHDETILIHKHGNLWPRRHMLVGLIGAAKQGCRVRLVSVMCRQLSANASRGTSSNHFRRAMIYFSSARRYLPVCRLGSVTSVISSSFV